MDKIAIVVGHSQWSQGAKAVDGIQEWTWHKVLAEQLLELIGDKGRIFFRPKGHYTKAMEQLVGEINTWHPDLVLSLHFNAMEGGTFRGTLALHWPTSTKGEAWAAAISAAVAEAQGTQDKGARSQSTSWAGAPLYILRDTDAPAVILESHYGNNAEDHEAATTARDLGQTAEALAEVLLATAV